MEEAKNPEAPLVDQAAEKKPEATPALNFRADEAKGQ